MLAAGYENQFNESLRYWRTRFVVIPNDELPLVGVGPPGEKLSEEEVKYLEEPYKPQAIFDHGQIA